MVKFFIFGYGDLNLATFSMEHVFCICGGLNQECDKCAGTGYVTPGISRPIVAFKFPVNIICKRASKPKAGKIKKKKTKRKKGGGAGKNVRKGAVIQFVNSPASFVPLTKTPLSDNAVRPGKAKVKKFYRSDFAHVLGEALRYDKTKASISKRRNDWK